MGNACCAAQNGGGIEDIKGKALSKKGTKADAMPTEMPGEPVAEEEQQEEVQEEEQEPAIEQLQDLSTPYSNPFNQNKISKFEQSLPFVRIDIKEMFKRIEMAEGMEKENNAEA